MIQHFKLWDFQGWDSQVWLRPCMLCCLEVAAFLENILVMMGWVCLVLAPDRPTGQLWVISYWDVSEPTYITRYHDIFWQAEFTNYYCRYKDTLLLTRLPKTAMLLPLPVQETPVEWPVLDLEVRKLPAGRQSCDEQTHAWCGWDCLKLKNKSGKEQRWHMVSTNILMNTKSSKLAWPIYSYIYVWIYACM